MIFDKYQSQSLEEILVLSATALAELKEAVQDVEPELETIGFNPPPSQEEPLWVRVGGNGYIHPMLHLISYANKRGDSARHRHLNLTMAEKCMALDDSPHWQGTTIYNLAGYHSQAGETEKAIELLSSALELRPSQIDWSRKDPDLDPIRSDPAYQRIYADLGTDA
jgi:tetratricopeptide (TPR) repeat protein